MIVILLVVQGALLLLSLIVCGFLLKNWLLRILAFLIINTCTFADAVVIGNYHNYLCDKYGGVQIAKKIEIQNSIFKPSTPYFSSTELDFVEYYDGAGELVIETFNEEKLKTNKKYADEVKSLYKATYEDIPLNPEFLKINKRTSVIPIININQK